MGGWDGRFSTLQDPLTFPPRLAVRRTAGRRITSVQLINFYKRRLLSQVVRDIQQYQQLPYSFDKTESLFAALTALPAHTEDECYNQSLLVEPREDGKAAPRPSIGAGTSPSSAHTPAMAPAPAASATVTAPTTARSTSAPVRQAAPIRAGEGRAQGRGRRLTPPPARWHPETTRRCATAPCATTSRSWHVGQSSQGARMGTRWQPGH